MITHLFIGKYYVHKVNFTCAFKTAICPSFHWINLYYYTPKFREILTYLQWFRLKRSGDLIINATNRIQTCTFIQVAVLSFPRSNSEYEPNLIGFCCNITPDTSIKILKTIRALQGNESVSLLLHWKITRDSSSNEVSTAVMYNPAKRSRHLLMDIWKVPF